MVGTFIRAVAGIVIAIAALAGPNGVRAEPQSRSPAVQQVQTDPDPSHYYVNASGHRVHRPMLSPSPPAGWTARCADGSYSFSEHRRGTCSHHGGLAQWR